MKTITPVVAAISVMWAAITGTPSSSAFAAAGPRAVLTPTPSENQLTIEAIYQKPSITGDPPSGIRWMADSRAISFLVERGEEEDKEKHLVIAALRDGKQRTLCIVDTIRVPDDLRPEDDEGKTKFSIGSYRWAKKGDLGVFRFKGDIFTVHARTGAIIRRTQSDVKEANVTFSPDGKSLAFTRDHDIWMLDLESGVENQLTTTGNDSIYNGVLDWVYMEELFTRGDVQGYWWSPDSRAIAYLNFDEGPVREFAMVDFKPVYNSAEMQHYPKAGTDNPIVRIAVYDIETRGTTWMNVDTADDSYIARVYWLGDSKHLAIEKVNRNQDELRLLFADVSTGEVKEILKETKSTWINITYNKHYYEKGTRFVWNSERDGNSHLYLYKNDGTMERQLTKGPWEVSSLDAVDERQRMVYFTALEKSILERHLYSVGENGKDMRRITKRDGTHFVTFSPDKRFYIDRFSDIETPSVISIHEATGRHLFTLHDSEGSDITEYNLPVPEFFTIKSREDVELQCSMIKPLNFSKRVRYPVLVYTYGGPHAQVVRNRWGGQRYLWHALMAEKGYIIFSLDNRGSYGKGPKWEDPILESMGYYELKDQIAGVEYLKSLPYVDSSRIGIWGWSYGGYMTSLAMFKAPGIYAAGAAVAPVSDWHYYDTIYTERYMKRPQDNEEGYEDSSPINFVDGLESPFLLIHGTADDNVHMANSIRLVDELIKQGKDFDLMLYPGKLHGIRGEKARVHLFKKLTKFFDQHLKASQDVSSSFP